jgi:ketopantoate reductase
MVQHKVSPANVKHPTICVFGAGSVGLALVAALERAGVGEGKLLLVSRGTAYEQIKSTGIFINISGCTLYRAPVCLVCF